MTSKSVDGLDPSRAMIERNDWTLVVRPVTPWLDLRFGELWDARELVALFLRRDFVASYKQTILGPIWYVIQPLLTTVMFTIIFSRVARLSTDGIPDVLFYMAGTVVWTYFSSCLTRTSNILASNAGLFGKVYFPRLTVPVSAVIANLLQFAIQFTLFLGFLLYYWTTGAAVHFTMAILALPILLLIMAGLGLGLGLITSSLTTRYRDLQSLVAFGVQLLMYATPVIYPMSAVPPGFRLLIQANPLTAVTEAFRGAFLGTSSVTASGLAYSAIVMCLLLTVGLLLFNRVERTFVDTV